MRRTRQSVAVMTLGSAAGVGVVTATDWRVLLHRLGVRRRNGSICSGGGACVPILLQPRVLSARSSNFCPSNLSRALPKSKSLTGVAVEPELCFFFSWKIVSKMIVPLKAKMRLVYYKDKALMHVNAFVLQQSDQRKVR